MPPKVVASKAAPKSSASHDTLPSINKDQQKTAPTNKAKVGSTTTTSSATTAAAAAPTGSKPTATIKTNGVAPKATNNHVTAPSSSQTKLPQIGPLSSKPSGSAIETEAANKSKESKDVKLVTPRILSPRQYGSSKDKLVTPRMNSSRKVESIPPPIVEDAKEDDAQAATQDANTSNEAETAMKSLSNKPNKELMESTTDKPHEGVLASSIQSAEELSPSIIAVGAEVLDEMSHGESNDIARVNNDTFEAIVDNRTTDVEDAPNAVDSDTSANHGTEGSAKYVKETDTNAAPVDEAKADTTADTAATNSSSSCSGNRSVRLLYELYNETFTVINGQLTSQDIDDVYNLSFVMPKCRIHLSKFNPQQRREMIIASNESGINDNDNDGLSSSHLFFVKESIVLTTPTSSDESVGNSNITSTVYHDLMADADYYVYVEQEVEQLKQDQLKMKQVANQMEGNDDNGGYDDDFEGHGDDDDDGDDEDGNDKPQDEGGVTTHKKKKKSTAIKDDGRVLESCSCVYGNPCVDEYGCRDWTNRFAIATTNGWKGF